MWCPGRWDGMCGAMMYTSRGRSEGKPLRCAAGLRPSAEGDALAGIGISPTLSVGSLSPEPQWVFDRAIALLRFRRRLCFRLAVDSSALRVLLATTPPTQSWSEVRHVLSATRAKQPGVPATDSGWQGGCVTRHPLGDALEILQGERATDPPLPTLAVVEASEALRGIAGIHRDIQVHALGQLHSLTAFILANSARAFAKRHSGHPRGRTAVATMTLTRTPRR